MRVGQQAPTVLGMKPRRILVAVLAAVSLTGVSCADSESTDPAIAGVTEAPADEPQIDGTYVVTYTEEDYTEAGVKDAAQIAENVGEFTWTLEDGEWSYSQDSASAERTEESGTYELDGATLTFRWAPATITMQVDVADDGSLVFTDVEDPSFQQLSDVQFGLHPWVPVG